MSATPKLQTGLCHYRSKDYNKCTKGNRTMQTRNPTDHAEVLLKETSLPSHEIAKMTGLDVYEVFGMKLKNRSYKFRGASQQPIDVNSQA